MSSARGAVRRWLAAATLALLWNGAAAGMTLELEPAQDNSLYETAPDGSEQVNERSNGAGFFLFAGRTGFDAGFKRRRALLRFDLSALPPGSEILHAELTLHQSKAAPGSPPALMGLHRVLWPWGEGSSDAVGAEGQGTFPGVGDATWHHSIYDILEWSSPGGDFAPAASSSVTVGQAEQPYTWPCTSALLDDLRTWHEDIGTNFGWIVIGGEATGQSAHRFDSRQHPDPAQRPRLRITYRPPDHVFADGFEAVPACD